MPALRHTTLRVLRERAGITQTELALAIGKAQPDISWYETREERLPRDVADRIFAELVRRYEDVNDSDDPFPPFVQPEDLTRLWDDVLLEQHKATA